jgi:hypothetical protein
MDKLTQRLEAGIAAAKAGKKPEAKRLLNQVVERDPDNEFAWLWLSAVVSGIDRQRECLHQVLKINPNNGYARHGLAFLSRLRPGQEWRAAEAPWVDGLDEVIRTRMPPRRCSRCGTMNPDWARSCARCGAVLQPIDIVESVRAEERVRTRSEASAAVIASWAGALVFYRDQAFEPEAELASLGRSLAALFLGGMLLILMRLGMGFVEALVIGRSLLPFLRGAAQRLLLDVGMVLGGALAAYLLLGAVSLLPAWLIGGEGSRGPGVHFHLVAVAVSSWLVVAAIGWLFQWGLDFILSAAMWQTLYPTVGAIVLGLLVLYAVVLLTQALQTAHQINFLVALTIALVVTLTGVRVEVALAPRFPQLAALLTDLWGVVAY